jgi:D-alanine-D-alanine ligase
MEKKLKRVDVAFLALHGHGGEDGVIQRLLERKKIPYIGSDVRASQRAFDKGISKRLFDRFGIPTPVYTIVKKNNWQSRLKRFPTPFFVKPLRDGSSVGVFCVEDLGKSAEKLRQAFERYHALIIEKKITGREFTVGILGNKALPVVELCPKRSFYDYRAKYTAGMTEYRAPAPISKRLAVRLQALGLKVHRSLGLRDFSRIDMMVDQNEKPYVLEANSIPGLTELSLLPKAARAANISFEELCGRLIAWAYHRSHTNSNKKVSKNGKKKT